MKPRTLRRKIEAGFVAFAKGLDATILEKYHFHESSVAETRKLPGFCFRADVGPEAIPGLAPKKCKLEIVQLTSIYDTENAKVPSDEVRAEIREQHDEALAALETALEAPGAVAALQAALNVGAPKRPVEDFHLYDITNLDEQPMDSEGKYADGLTFEVLAQNCDGA